jgi:hypothetical protein
MNQDEVGPSLNKVSLVSFTDFPLYEQGLLMEELTRASRANVSSETQRLYPDQFDEAEEASVQMRDWARSIDQAVRNEPDCWYPGKPGERKFKPCSEWMREQRARGLLPRAV